MDNTERGYYRVSTCIDDSIAYVEALDWEAAHDIAREFYPWIIQTCDQCLDRQGRVDYDPTSRSVIAMIDDVGTENVISQTIVAQYIDSPGAYWQVVSA